MTTAAYYYGKTKARPAQVDIATISATGGRVWTHQGIDVKDKREARKIASEYGATPWNF